MDCGLIACCDLVHPLLPRPPHGQLATFAFGLTVVERHPSPPAAAAGNAEICICDMALTVLHRMCRGRRFGAADLSVLLLVLLMPRSQASTDRHHGRRPAHPLHHRRNPCTVLLGHPAGRRGLPERLLQQHVRPHPCPRRRPALPTLDCSQPSRLRPRLDARSPLELEEHLSSIPNELAQDAAAFFQVGSSGCWQRQPAASAASCTPPPQRAAQGSGTTGGRAGRGSRTAQQQPGAKVTACRQQQCMLAAALLSSPGPRHPSQQTLATRARHPTDSPHHAPACRGPAPTTVQPREASSQHAHRCSASSGERRGGGGGGAEAPGCGCRSPGVQDGTVTGLRSTYARP